MLAWVEEVESAGVVSDGEGIARIERSIGWIRRYDGVESIPLDASTVCEFIGAEIPFEFEVEAFMERVAHLAYQGPDLVFRKARVAVEKARRIGVKAGRKVGDGIEFPDAEPVFPLGGDDEKPTVRLGGDRNLILTVRGPEDEVDLALARIMQAIRGSVGEIELYLESVDGVAFQVRVFTCIDSLHVLLATHTVLRLLISRTLR